MGKVRSDQTYVMLHLRLLLLRVCKVHLRPGRRFPKQGDLSSCIVADDHYESRKTPASPLVGGTLTGRCVG